MPDPKSTRLKTPEEATGEATDAARKQLLADLAAGMSWPDAQRKWASAWTAATRREAHRYA